MTAVATDAMSLRLVHPCLTKGQTRPDCAPMLIGIAGKKRKPSGEDSMSKYSYPRLMAAAVVATFIVSCGGSDDAAAPPITPSSAPEQSPSAYLQTLPKWEQFSPP